MSCSKSSSSSMDLGSLPHSTTMLHRKSSFPTHDANTNILGEEAEPLLHFIHPQHPLYQISIPDLFTCTGCKEFGAGNLFTCRHCDFQLHDFCALAPPFLNHHPLHYQHQLLFNSKPVKGGKMRTKCDICGKPCKMFNYQCTACSFQMHTCCAMLSSEMDFPVHPHTLMLLPTTMTLSINGGDPYDFPCGECKRKRSGRVYRCPTCNYHIHAVCAKNMINGLHANGFKAQEKQSMLGAAARLASLVFKDFIGGLVEGIGEGVGQALIQNMVRGRCLSRRR